MPNKQRKQAANVIFALHFDDVTDPRYLAIVKLLTAHEMWTERNLVFSSQYDNRAALVKAIEILSEAPHE